MSINSINRLITQPNTETSSTNQVETPTTNDTNLNNAKSISSKESSLSNNKDSMIVSNKMQEGNFVASFQSARLQNMMPSTTAQSPNSNSKSTSYEAKQIIDANTSFFNLDEDKLGKTLSTIAKQQPNLVKETFQQLSSSDKVQVAQAFVDNLTNNNSLKDLAKSPEGNKLLVETYNILSNQQSILVGKSDPRLSTISKALVDVAKEQTKPLQNATTNQPSTIKNTEQLQNSESRELPLNAIPKQGDPQIRYELSGKGEGYVVYNRNDTNRNYKKSDGVAPELTGKRLPDQIATKETIDKLQTLGKEWNKLHPERPIQIGDISLPGGVDTPDHATHQDGQTVDIRPFRNDDKQTGVTFKNKGEYDQQTTREFIQLVREKYPDAKFYFNDPQLIREFPGVISHKKNHDDHLHIIFAPREGKK